MPWGQELMVFEQNDDGVAPFNVGEDVNISWEAGFTFGLRGDEDAEAGTEVNPEEIIEDDE
jgi:spermidine/putrescine transport system ATP-binding protein